MSIEESSKFEELQNIKLVQLYEFVTEVVRDFGYTLHKTLKDHEVRRRIELWSNQSKDNELALVWIEIVKPGEIMDSYTPTDVLRTMNDENITHLFFFTNMDLPHEIRDVLEGMDNHIFDMHEIAENLIAIDNRRLVNIARKRKVVRIPSGVGLIKNFMKNNLDARKEIKLKVSAAPELTNQYLRVIRKILDEVDSIEDINNLNSTTKERLKLAQYELLPELVKIPNFIFTRQFTHLRNTIFTLVEYVVIYLGNVLEYESEDSMKKNRDVIEEIVERLEYVGQQVMTYKEDMMLSSEKLSLKILISSGIFCLLFLLVLIVVKYTG